MVDRAKILVVDDEEIVLDSCRRILRGGDFEVATAADGEQGLLLFESFGPDLVFVDLKMPGLSGIEVLERLASIDPNVVTIVITGFATVGSAVESMKRGAYDFLPKPFTPDEFRLITRRGLERRRLILETIALRRQKELFREHFAAIVSHELKGPLSAVQQNLFVLEHQLQDRVTEDERERLGRMKAKLDDLVKLIHTWLRVLMVDVSMLRETFAPTDIATVVRKALENVAPHANRMDVDIRTEVDPAAGSVLGDEGTLVEALANIVGNAVKYSSPGSDVLVRIRREADAVTIAVVDHGIGIAEADLPYVFEDFFRTAPGQATAEGSGLGLSITRRIVEAHDGSVAVESQPGRGSTFTIRLPSLSSESRE